MSVNLLDDDPEFVEQLAEHARICDLESRLCADCRLTRDRAALSAIAVARSEYELVKPWINMHRWMCVYCAGSASSRDHLVPLPWTGPVARRFVPTVPACGDCNSRINDALVHTIAGRAERVAKSLRRRHRKQLGIEDHPPEWFHGFSARMASNLKAAQAARQVIRRRLIILDAGGAVVAPSELLDEVA